MSLRIRQEGLRMDHTPVAALTAGACVVVGGGILGVATSDMPAGVPGSLDATTGRIYEIVANGGIPAPAIGDLLFAIPASGLLTKTATSNVQFGRICNLVPLSVRAFYALVLCLLPGLLPGLAIAQTCKNGRCDASVLLEP